MFQKKISGWDLNKQEVLYKKSLIYNLLKNLSLNGTKKGKEEKNKSNQYQFWQLQYLFTLFLSILFINMK